MSYLEGTQELLDGLEHLSRPMDSEQSESEDEIGLSSLIDQDSYSAMNIPESMKNILRINSDKNDFGSIQDDSESDNDSMYKTHEISIDHLNRDISKNKFVNFPLMPEQQDEEAQQKKKTKKPREKKKKRDKGKKRKEEEEDTTNNDSLLANFAKFAAEESDEDIQPKKKKSKGRKTRKDTSHLNKVDENGERLVRTTEFLDTDSDPSSDEERALSKKQEMEMYRESERLRRSRNIRLKPAYHVKSFADLIQRHDEREKLRLERLEKEEKNISSNPIAPTIHKRVEDDSSDDGLIILNKPGSILSPERTRNPSMNWSPMKSAAKAHKSHNQSLLARVANEGYAYRMKIEQEAKARGQYSSATERAKKLLEKENSARRINAQIQMHFERNKQNNLDDDDDEELDDDYRDSNDEDDDDEQELDYLQQLSGQDEDDNEDEDNSTKREMGEEDFEEEDDDDEEDDMGTMAMNRWKSKNIKKSIFEDSDDDEEIEKKKITTAPTPAHSISNFFKAKEKEAAKSAETIEEKTLVRLKRRPSQESIDAMDIDEPVVRPKIHKQRPETTDPKEKSEYFEEEAEEEEDEFFGAGGEDIDNGENLDEFEEDDLLVHENDEHVDEAALRDAYNKQDAESDSNMIQRLLTDVTGGGLRKQKAAAEAGLILDDVDLYDDEDNDLIAIRLAAAARRRKMLRKKGGDPLESLMNNPRTTAFAKALQTLPDDAVTSFLSDIEGEDDEEEAQTAASDSTRVKLVIKEEDDEEDEKDDLMDVFSDEDDLVVEDVNPMASPMRGGLVNNMIITSADDNDEEFQIENTKSIHSPLNNRRTKSMFDSPVSLNRFKRLMSETNNNTSDTARIGFGSTTGPKPTKSEKEEIPKTFGSIGGFIKHGGATTTKKSRLGSLLKKPDAFKYVDK